MGDVDGDGFSDDVVVTTLTNWTYAINETGGRIWGVPVGGVGNAQPGRSELFLLDLDRDGIKSEVVVYSKEGEKVVAINRTGQILWNFTVGHYSTSLTAGDIDRNGFVDNLALSNSFAGQNRRLTVLNNMGEVLWNYTSSQKVYNLFVGDIDGSNFSDNVIIGTTPIIALDHTGNEIGRGGQGGFPYLGDFDGGTVHNDLMTGYTSVTLHRLGSPNVNCTITDSLNDLVSGPDGFYFTLTNGESFPLDIDCTFSIPGQSSEWYLNGQDISVGNTTSLFTLNLDAGTYNLTISLAHDGVVFKEIQVPLSVKSAPIGTSIFLYWLVAMTIIMSFWKISKEKLVETKL